MSTTSENNKRIAKNTLLLYFRMFLIMAITLYTSRIILETLGVEDYGIYNVVGGIISMVSILNGALSVSTQRFLTFELGTANINRLKTTFSTCLIIYIFAAFILLILAETIGLWFLNTQLIIPEDRCLAANITYQCSVFITIISLLYNPYNAAIIAHEEMNIFAYISIFDAILKLISVYILSTIPYDSLIIYAILTTLTSTCITLIYIFYCLKHYEECKPYLYCDKNLFKKLLSYNGWNLFGSGAAIVKGQGLNVILNIFFTPSVVAARGISLQVSTAIQQFFNNFYIAVRPQIIKYYAQGNYDNMFKLVLLSSRFSFYLIYILSLPLIIETPAIIKLWLGQLPDYVVPFTRITLVITAIDSMANPLMTTAHATGKISFYQAFVGSLTILILPLSWIFLNLNFGPIIVFYISLIMSIIAFFARIFIVKNLIKHFPAYKFIKETLLHSLLIVLLSIILPIIIKSTFHNILGESIIVVFSCVISTLMTLYFVGLNTNEKEKCHIYILKLLKK